MAPSWSGLFTHLVALLAASSLVFYRVKLQETVQLSLVAPHALVVVVAQFSGGWINDEGVIPAGQLNE